MLEALQEPVRSIAAFVLLILSIFFGMLINGISRKMSARMQHRYGPPVVQPWYDFIKLVRTKEEVAHNPTASVFVYGFVAFNLAAVFMLLFMYDIIMVVLLLGAAQLFVALIGYAGSSPYSHAGANRMVLQVISSEPLLLLAVLGIFMYTGTVSISSIVTQGITVVAYLPMVLVVLVFVLLLTMQKSPFDLVKAHQEFVYGPYSELSGPALAFVEFGHWIESFAVIGLICMMFDITNLVSGTVGIVLDLAVKVVVAFVVILIVTLIDNATTRLHWSKLPKLSYYYMLPLLMLNIVVVYFLKTQGVIS